MRENTLDQPQKEPPLSSELRDLQSELLQPMIALSMALGWFGMVFVLTTTAKEGVHWLTVFVFALLFGVGFVSWGLSWAGTAISATAARLLMGAGGVTIALGYYLTVPTSESYVWVIVACVVAQLLIGHGAGLLAVGVLSACVVWINVDQLGHPFSLATVMAGIAPPLTLIIIIGMAGRLLIRTLQWMTQGYTLARQKSIEMRDKAAELAMALKSLEQTSFAFARANEQLEVMVSIAEDAQRAKQEFAANISHELRTPLNLIIGFADVILSAPTTYELDELPQSLVADMRVIDRNARHLLSLVNDVLDLGQMDANYVTLTREPVDMAQIIDNALVDFKPLIINQGLALHVQVEDQLPVLNVDRVRIRQVLLNLISNALRFTSAGSIIVRAWLQKNQISGIQHFPPALDTTDCVIISVADTGIGISKADVERIFEPFVQVDASARRRFGGTGLGLTISKRFVDLHGGRIWVESQPGQGSVFSFSIPLVALPFAPTHSSVKSPHRHELSCVAVIEPEPMLSRILHNRLGDLSVSWFRSIQELPASSESGMVEAIIVNDPKLDSGCLSIRAQALPLWPQLEDIPVFFCQTRQLIHRSTAADPEQPSAESSRLIYLSKPFSREQLYDSVEHCLKQARNAPNMASDGNSYQRPAHVLIVDDDEDMLALTRRWLATAPVNTHQGFTGIVPMTAKTGEQAQFFLQKWHDRRCDAILLSLELADGTNGQGIFEAIRDDARLRDIPVCMMTREALRDGLIVTPYLTIMPPQGLSAMGIIQACQALLPLVIPGLAQSSGASQATVLP